MSETIQEVDRPPSNSGDCSIPPDGLVSFEDAFDSHSVGFRSKCECGRTFYDNYNSGYDVPESEWAELEGDTNATALPHAVGGVHFDGVVFRGCLRLLAPSRVENYWMAERQRGAGCDVSELGETTKDGRSERGPERGLNDKLTGQRPKDFDYGKRTNRHSG